MAKQLATKKTPVRQKISPEKTRKTKSFDLARRVAEAASEVKGRDIVVLDVSQQFGLADYFVVVSGRSDRQVQGISNKIIDTLLEQGIEANSREGLEEGQWVLIDFGDVVAHVFYEATREHYDIEGLWGQSPKTPFDELRQPAKARAA